MKYDPALTKRLKKTYAQEEVRQQILTVLKMLKDPDSGIQKATLIRQLKVLYNRADEVGLLFYKG